MANFTIFYRVYPSYVGIFAKLQPFSATTFGMISYFPRLDKFVEGMYEELFSKIDSLREKLVENIQFLSNECNVIKVILYINNFKKYI